MNDHTTSPTVTPDPDRDGVILHLPEITYLDTQTWAVDVGLTAEGLAALRTLLGAAPAVPALPVDQPALREVAAQAIRDAACTGDCGQTEEECRAERIQPFAWQHGTLAVVEGSPEQLAAAVLAAVLPAPVDPAALVRACASFVRDTYSGEWADDAAATLETDADKIERGEPCSLLRLAAVLPAATNHDTDTGAPLSETERKMLEYALDLADEEIATDGSDFTDDEEDALAELRRIVTKPIATGTFELRGDTGIRAAALREAIALLDQRASSVDALSSSDFGEEARAVRELADVANELRRVADETAATETQPPAALSPTERTMLGYALDQAQERIWSEDGFTDEDQAAVDSLRRLTAEQPAAGARQDGAQP